MLRLPSLREYIGNGRALDAANASRLAAWRDLPEADLRQRHAALRYVVLDTETTGLDMRHDRVISIGAVGVSALRIHLADCFQTVLRQDAASAHANILIHGIGGQRQLGGVDPVGGLLASLEFMATSPLVAFRAEFDRTMFVRAARMTLGFAPRRTWIDLALLLPALFDTVGDLTLDEWLRHFGLGGAARHEAIADAFATAQLLQIALAEADRQSMNTAADLVAMQKAQRWLGKR